MATEITNQVRAMEVLERGREQLSFITDALPALVCYLDTSQRYQFLNLAHEEWFGIPRSQFYGRTLQDIVDEQAYATMLPYSSGPWTARAPSRPRSALAGLRLARSE
jgi:PAS domain-containing protein